MTPLKEDVKQCGDTLVKIRRTDADASKKR